MESIDVIGVVILIVGAIVCYGAKPIGKVLKFKDDDSKILILKAAGFLIAIAGFLKLMKII